MLPLSYAVRNLFRSQSRMLQTVLGSGLVVMLVMAAVSINLGMSRVLATSGSPHHVILVGAGSEESIQRSEISDQVPEIASAAIPGISEELGVRAVGGEIHHMTYVFLDGGKKAQSLVRGVTPQALSVYPQVRLTGGRFPGSGEVLVGRLAWRRFGIDENGIQPGSTLSTEGQRMTVSGIFAAPGTVLESELWVPLGDLKVLAKRETLSCVVMRLQDPTAFDDADLFTKQRLDLEISAIRESDYYQSLDTFYKPLRAITWITAGLIASGALLGGFNTLYAAFAPRIREMATLQAIGFGRGSLWLSLVQESTLASLIGTLLGSITAVFLLDGRTVPFSMATFRLEIEFPVAFSGIATGLLLGLLGAIPPAIRCLAPSLHAALRSS